MESSTTMGFLILILFFNLKICFSIVYFCITEKTIKIDDAYTVLKGHRSIVNHVSYSERNNLLISSGVEKVIKVSFCFNFFFNLKIKVLEFI